MSPSPAISPPSNAPSVSTAALVLLLLFSWACLYLVGLGMPELQGEEARRILPGRTMLQTGDWIVPRSAGQVYNRKPPLINWATAASIQLTGRMDEWSARLPSALAMLALALGVLFATRRWLGQGAAFLAACICLTNIGFLEKGRLAEIESIYIACFGLALVSWLGAWWADRRWLAWISAGLFLGVGFLAKGPPHVWYFYALIVGVLAAEGRLKELIRPAHGVGVLAFLLPWVPWALENARRNPQGDSQKVWADQITHRIGFSEFDWSNWLLQIPQSLVNFLPWLLLLPLLWSPAITSQWPQLGRRGSWMRGLRAGLVVGFLVIALLPSSRPRFMLPLNVAAALLVAQFFALLSTDRQARLLRLMTRGFIGIGLLAILAGFG
ncbi:MAG: glycosyltransferase family 39 protein, partial [Verrucomicrobiales bacterium]|nr:glycosyltransferase family 39 protein [Verrucomicrobiales bacterium]